MCVMPRNAVVMTCVTQPGSIGCMCRMASHDFHNQYAEMWREKEINTYFS